MRERLIHLLGGLTRAECRRKALRAVHELRDDVERHVRSEVPESGLVEEYNRGYRQALRHAFNLGFPMARSGESVGFESFSIDGHTMRENRDGRWTLLPLDWED